MDDNHSRPENKIKQTSDIRKYHQLVTTMWSKASSRNKTILKLLPVVLIFLAIPITIVLLQQQQNLFSRASGQTSIEPESSVLSGSVTVGSDSNASGGKYIQFGTDSITGTTYYLDCQNGNDSNNGTSDQTPWQSLTKANNASFNPGDGLLLKRGCAWTGSLKVSRSGTATNNIIIGAYGSGDYPTIQSSGDNTSELEISGNYITVDNIYAKGIAPALDTGCRNNPIGFIIGFRIKSTANNVTIKNSKATGNYAGVYIEYGSNNNKVLNGIFQNNVTMHPLDTTVDNDAGAFGVLIHGNNNEIAYNNFSGQAACTYDYGANDGADVEIYRGQNNTIHHNSSVNSNGFSELGGNSTTKAADNTFAYNKFISDLPEGYFLITRGAGSGYGPTYRTKAYNNTVYLTGSSSQAVVCHAGCSSDILTLKNNILWAGWKSAYADAQFNESNNIYWRTGGSPLVQGFTINSTSKKIDPQFISTGTDFRLKSTSPAINSGTLESVNLGYTTDLDSFKVPYGTGVDVGSHEYGSSIASANAIKQVAGTSSFTFGAVGDHGAGSNSKAVLKSIGANNLGFFLSLGDLSYGDLTEPNWCQMVKDNINIGAGKSTGDTYGNTYPFEIIAGGHENGVDNPTDGLIENFISSSCLPDRLNVIQSRNLGINPSASGNYAKEFYFDYPQLSPIARIIGIDPHSKMLYGYDASCGTSTNCLDFRKGSPRYNWLSATIDDARAKGIKWIIVANHENYISTGIKGNEIGPDYFNLLLEKKVDLVLQGHEHNYERSKQLAFSSSCTSLSPSASVNTACIADNGSDGTFNKGAGTVLLINGMGGIGTYALSTSDPQAGYFASTQNTVYGLSKFTVSDSQLTAEFIKGQNLSGTFTDTFTILADGIAPTPTPTTPSSTSTPSPTSAQSTPSPTPTSTTCSTQLPTDTGTGIAFINSLASTYKVWSRMSSELSNNSYYLQVDDQCPILVGDVPSSAAGWQWVDYKNGSVNDKTNITLEAGTHTIKLVGREPGVKLDRVILTSDSTCVPQDFGDNCLTTIITPTQTLSPTFTPTPTLRPTITPTQTPSPSPTFTPTPTLKPTITPTKTVTPTPTITTAPTISPAPTLSPGKEKKCIKLAIWKFCF